MSIRNLTDKTVFTYILGCPVSNMYIDSRFCGALSFDNFLHQILHIRLRLHFQVVSDVYLRYK